MTLFGIELTKFSIIGGVGMLAFGILDYIAVNWALSQGEQQAERDGTLDADKMQAFGRVRTVLAVVCFLGFPLVGVLAGDAVIRSVL